MVAALLLAHSVSCCTAGCDKPLPPCRTTACFRQRSLCNLCLPVLMCGVAQLSREWRERRLPAAHVCCSGRLGRGWRRGLLRGPWNGGWRGIGGRGCSPWCLFAGPADTVGDPTVGVGRATDALRHVQWGSPNQLCTSDTVCHCSAAAAQACRALGCALPRPHPFVAAVAGFRTPLAAGLDAAHCSRGAGLGHQLLRGSSLLSHQKLS